MHSPSRVLSALLLLQAVVSSGLGDPADGARYSIDTSQVSMDRTQQQIGSDPVALFAYVRDAIRDDIYPGVLRGGNGALLSKAASSLDKAVLLGGLLSHAGLPVRFVHGKLTPAQAKVLWSSLVIPASMPPGSADAPSLTAKQKAFAGAVTGEVQAQYKIINQALADAGFHFSAGAATSADLLADHYWVQYKSGDKWIDLDPGFPHSKAGEAHAAVIEAWPDIPDALFQHFTVRVLIEEQTDGPPQKRTLLTYAAKTADLSGRTLVLTHRKGSWEKPVPMTALTAGLGSALGAFSTPTVEDNAKPVLLVGDDYKVGDTFDLPDPSHETPATAPAPAFSLGDLGGMISGGSSPKNKVVREWIEFETQVPGGAPETTERVIFDRIGWAARRAGETKPSDAPLGLNHPLNSLFSISIDTGPLANDDILVKQDGAAPGDKSGPVELCGMLEAINHAVSLLGDRMASPLVLDGEPVLYAMASPRVLITGFSATKERAVLSIDEHRADYAPLAGSDKLAARIPLLRLLRGVVDGVAEASLGNLLFAPETAQASKVEAGSYSAVQVFHTAIAAGTKVGLAKPAEVSASPDAMARIADDLASGHLVVVPQHSVSLNGRDLTGWWRINPASGETVAMTEDGLHGESDEYAVVVYKTQLEAGSRYTVYNIVNGEWQVSYIQGQTADMISGLGEAVAKAFRIYLSLQ